MSDLPLSGRVALVTGGSRGLGRGCCLGLARAGCNIAVNYQKNVSGAEETKQLIEKESPSVKVRIYQCDVSEENEVNDMIESINVDMGIISILVNNAGIGSVRELHEVSLEEFDRFLKVNLRSAFIVTQRVYPQMIQQHWGRIIFMTSIAAYIGGGTGPHYSASKAGLIGLTNSYAQRLISHGITSNAVSPGLVESDMVNDMCDKLGRDRVLQRTTGGKFGKPEDVANVVTMLATNPYVNGQVIGVDGGIHKK